MANRQVTRPPSPCALWHHRKVTSTDSERRARTAYEAYRDAQKGSVPAWEDTSEQEQRAWRAAVSAVAVPGDDTITDGTPAQSLVVLAGDDTHVFHREFTAGRQGSLAISDEHKGRPSLWLHIRLHCLKALLTSLYGWKRAKS
jgi:hypothetical protein